MINNGKKKVILSVLLYMLIVALVFTGCSGNRKQTIGKDDENIEKNNGQKEEKSEGGEEIIEDLGYPIVDKPLTLTMWTPLRKAASTLTDFNEKSGFQVMEEATGIHIEFIHPAAGQEKDQFNIMVASGDLPDLIFRDYFRSPADALTNEIILPLNELVDEYSPNYKEVLDEYPAFKKTMYTDEDELVGFGFCQPFPESFVGGFMIRKDWLDKLNLDVPETIDQWENVLTAFKEGDPNGNGEPDEIPYGREPASFVTAWGITYDFYIDGGVNEGSVKYGPIQPEFKEYITKMNDWYKKGLIDKDYLTTDGKLRDANMTGHKIGAIYGGMYGNLGNWTALMREDPDFLLWPTPLPKLDEESEPYIDHGRALTLNAATGYITTANKHPIESVRWFDWGYTNEGRLALNFGKEGLTYEMIDEYPVYTDEVMNNPDGLSTSDAIAKHCQAGDEFSFVAHPAYVEQIAGSNPSQRQALKIWNSGWVDKIELNLGMPQISLTRTEQESDKNRINDINTYRNEMIDKFITGQEPLDNFENFVNQIKEMGIDDAIKVRQDALERWQMRGDIEFKLRYEEFKANYDHVKFITNKGEEFLEDGLK